METITLVEATRRAVAQEMRRDPSVWVLGEDVARGGIFGQYRGLVEEFGPERIVSTPISEATIMGAGLGAALVGTRPVIDMRIFDFALCAMDELVNQIAKIRYMFGGQAKPAVVIRAPHGLWRSSAAQHSQSLEAWFAHLPGVVVAAPATPADAAGLLVAAIRSDDPVLFFDPKALFGATGPVATEIAPLPFGVARRVRSGDDLTLVCWSAIVPECERAAAALAREGTGVDLLDLRTLWPWDEEAVVASVARTGRLLVVHEAVRAGGFGGEILSRVVERLGPGALRAARRVGAPRLPVPFSPPLEDAVRVTEAKIVAAAKSLLAA
ncbi:MAG: alpha-ketoacid dehydrogenase subunit beta [Dehalococcoidia bacterium]|nr:alpha-ketoacid dehydrogenase subunit beta [Dehalococcoidia bacterium]